MVKPLPRKSPGPAWKIVARGNGRVVVVKETTIYLIRHGEIEANIQRRWHGRTDSELTDVGVEQAKRLGHYLHKQHNNIQSIYSSPLKRTRHTTELINKQLHLQPVFLDGLMEYGIGILENTPYDELHGQVGFFSKIAADPHYAPNHGESLREVMTRMLAAICAIRQKHVGQEVAVVGHGAAMAIALAGLMDGRPFPFFQYHTSNTGLSKLILGESSRLDFFDRTDHLES